MLTGLACAGPARNHPAAIVTRHACARRRECARRFGCGAPTLAALALVPTTAARSTVSTHGKWGGRTGRRVRRACHRRASRTRRSAHGQHAVSARSAHGQHAVSEESARGRPTGSTRSARDQHSVSAWSTQCQHAASGTRPVHSPHAASKRGQTQSAQHQHSVSMRSAWVRPTLTDVAVASSPSYLQHIPRIPNS